MGAVHVVFGSTLLLTFGMNLMLTLPGSESASFFDRVIESEPATAIKGVLGQFLPRPQKDQPQPDQQSTIHAPAPSTPTPSPTTPSTTTTDKTASEPGSILNRVIGHFIPQLHHQQSDSKPNQKANSTSATTTTSTSTTTTDAPKQSDPPSLKSEGVKTTTEEGGSATVPPYVATCYLWKNESGTIKAVQMSRDEAGNNTYLDYEEYCNGDDVDTRISAGALASLAGRNRTNEEEGLSTMPTYDEVCYLQKNDSGVINTIYMSRAEAGNETYLDYEEICDDGADVAVPLYISAGALASLAG